LILAGHIRDAPRLDGIVVVVVVFSVLVQGSLTPAAARLLRVPMRTLEPQPWVLGVRLSDEPQGVHRFTVERGAPADGRRIADLAELPEHAWISLVVRDRSLVPVRATTVLQQGDEVLVLSDVDRTASLRPIFEIS
jgi:cell volume regulation protein A